MHAHTHTHVDYNKYLYFSTNGHDFNKSKVHHHGKNWKNTDITTKIETQEDKWKNMLTDTGTKWILHETWWPCLEIGLVDLGVTHKHQNK